MESPGFGRGFFLWLVLRHLFQRFLESGFVLIAFEFAGLLDELLPLRLVFLTNQHQGI